MLYCGLKLTHDGGVAVIDDDRLVFSVEMEKLDNRKRYTAIEDSADIVRILASHGLDPSMIDAFVVDGWGGTNADALAIQPRLTIGSDGNRLAFASEGEGYALRVAAYQESRTTPIHQETPFDGLRLGRATRPYSSVVHVAGHVFSAYCSSPFAARGESSYVLVWDGGMLPRLYYVDAERGSVEPLGPIFMLVGNTYSIFAQHFGPFRVSDTFAKDSLSVAGKVMAYIALGQARADWIPILDRIYREQNDASMGFANALARHFKAALPEAERRDEDVLATFHVFIEQLLCSKLVKAVGQHPTKQRNLCLSGGCALNIKWNSAVRRSGAFDAVYVPPFPNDSGSAIGAAAAARFNRTGELALSWSVYSGPAVRPSEPATGWTAREAPVAEVARHLHHTGAPLVFLHGKAELGPRALGARSILAAPTSPAMKDELNRVKRREAYRPVSPICLEHRAPEIFDPGSPDPFMLFDHRVRAGWRERIPAVIHLDGTARLQTIHSTDYPAMAELLTEYEKVSGIPLLCNTSANLAGAGFFPDARSAMEWGGVDHVWSDGVLYQRAVGGR